MEKKIGEGDDAGFQDKENVISRRNFVMQVNFHCMLHVLRWVNKNSAPSRVEIRVRQLGQ